MPEAVSSCAVMACARQPNVGSHSESTISTLPARRQVMTTDTTTTIGIGLGATWSVLCGAATLRACRHTRADRVPEGCLEGSTRRVESDLLKAWRFAPQLSTRHLAVTTLDRHPTPRRCKGPTCPLQACQAPIFGARNIARPRPNGQQAFGHSVGELEHSAQLRPSAWQSSHAPAAATPAGKPGRAFPAG
jgi:hypothetical protein